MSDMSVCVCVCVCVCVSVCLCVCVCVCVYIYIYNETKLASQIHDQQTGCFRNVLLRSKKVDDRRSSKEEDYDMIYLLTEIGLSPLTPINRALSFVKVGIAAS